jgi:hypothetical protein
MAALGLYLAGHTDQQNYRRGGGGDGLDCLPGLGKGSGQRARPPSYSCVKSTDPEPLQLMQQSCVLCKGVERDVDVDTQWCVGCFGQGRTGWRSDLGTVANISGGNDERECHRRTLEGLKDTAEKLGDFRLEEDLIDAAVTALIKDEGIA